MIKVFQVDFVRAVLQWQLNRNYKENNYENFSSDDISLFSFYEHLLNQDEVNRYVETYQAMVDEQNREHQIGFGVIATDTSPTITNLYSTFISPFDWTLRIRTQMANRDKMLGTLYNLIKELKGVKVDVASLHCYDENDNYVGEKLFPVGTIYEKLESGDYIGDLSEDTQESFTDLYNSINEKLGVSPRLFSGFTLYATNTLGNLTRWVAMPRRFGQVITYFWVNETTNEYDFDSDDIADSVIYNIPNHKGFDKFKLDLSLEDITCDEPYTLDADEYCDIRIGGSATLVSGGVRLGNDLVRVAIGKEKIVASNDGTQDIDLRVDDEVEYTFVEPLEQPNSLNANTENNILRSNFFLANSNTDTIVATLQYSFVCDMDIPLIRQWFNYSRYYDCNLENGQITKNSITPNIVYSIKEYWNSWGNIEIRVVKAKLVGSIDIENNESDTMSIQLSFQLQGENN